MDVVSNSGRSNESPQSRAWRDPSELPSYLDDELEDAAPRFLIGSGTAASLMSGIIGDPVPDDPLLDDTSTNEEEIEKTALRALDRLSPGATDYYRVAQQFLARLDDAPAASSMLAHALRELDGTIRGVWWDLSCFVDEEAERTREAARGTGGRDAPHKRQIELLSRRLSLTEEEKQTWLQAAEALPGLAHRARVGPSRRLSLETQRLVRDTLALFIRIVRATESTYGDAVLRAAALVEAGPSKDTKDTLSHHLPHHPPLRRWLLAQIDDPLWLRPLHAAGVLSPSEPIWVNPGGSPVAPVCPGARATARVAALVRDDKLLDELITGWLGVNNPRLHTDVVQILIEARSPLYGQYVEPLCEWVGSTWAHSSIVRLVGDLGVLRFPSHCLRLVARACADGRTYVAERLSKATADALAEHASDKDSFDNTARLALLGAALVLDETSKRLIRRAFEGAAEEVGW